LPSSIFNPNWLLLAETGQLVPESLVDRLALFDWSDPGAFAVLDGGAASADRVALPAPAAAPVLAGVADVFEPHDMSTRTPLKLDVFISAILPASPDMAVEPVVLASDGAVVCGLVGVVRC